MRRSEPRSDLILRAGLKYDLGGIYGTYFERSSGGTGHDGILQTGSGNSSGTGRDANAVSGKEQTTFLMRGAR